MSILCNIIYNKEINQDIFEMRLENKDVVAFIRPGMFINIDVKDKSMLLKRPISIKEVLDDGFIICYKIMGKGTEKLSKIKKGSIEITGPSGNGFPLVKDKKVLVVGGGIGIPPLYELVRNLENCDITTILGVRTNNQIIYEEDFKKYSKVVVTTDDGSYGYKGNPLNYIEEHNLDFDVIYACGPKILLKSIDMKYKGQKLGFISIEERMACGIGACAGCVVETNEGYKRVCYEGPVFELGVVDYGS